MTITDNGWDSRAWLEGNWLHREPRRAEVHPRLLAETRLLPWLAPKLPLPVPIPEQTQYGVRHRLLVGEPLTEGSTALGRQLGEFLRALHGVDPAEAVQHGAGDAETAESAKRRFLAECRERVVPLLPVEARSAASELLDRVGGPRTALVHCDLGPEHLLVRDGRITGVIDWTDAEIGDPAVDLSWLLHDAPAGIAEGVAETYAVSTELRERARDWHKLGPWYEAHRGLLLDLPNDVASGRAGILSRL
ncbi:aminoglycoside phosphotransferase [Kribbella flavida DSM 17836]|uniref:Aminoglycoside phosphotransferase n=1 Tax=Kribbella flavida (strain DSM 17836 / JCM 10339 / NBRC 14399) TaxID=479435 RepID=D2Q4G9_KRIFD|nr:phosphotransferase [Kribbella flavida]ADB32283.1 aminoglycoside phosphotransferase [Kribbella flavida DSM 17836]